ncbi:hypothetical protein BsWGS_23853 [Bradybaena similaris]
MAKTRSSGILKFCIWLWVPAFHHACPYKGCDCSPPDIFCEGLNLQAIPEITDSNTTGLTSFLLAFNNITLIPKGSLIPNLTTLNVEGNPITTIDDAAFEGSATTLTQLSFSNVGFARIPDAFGHLHALQGLSISYANITDWNSDVWKSFSQSLQTLSLYNVSMTSWPVWIQYFNSLQELMIDIGFISSIPDNALDGVMDTLTMLSLQGNKLTIIPKAISKLKGLQMLHLEHNRITDIRWIPQNGKLFSVTLDNNYISDAVQLSQVLRPYGRSLTSLGIENNYLTSIPDLSYLSQIGILDLTYNRISDPLSGAVPANLNVIELSYNTLPLVPRVLSTLYSVTDIFLAYNSIKAIQEGDFHNQTTSIDLSYNMITELSDTSFPESFGLLNLNLNSNPLTYISPAVLKRLTNLSDLNINHSRLTRLPLALGYFSKLDFLDVSDSVDLVCTCMESALRPWIMNLGQFGVDGTCGGTTVYYFFSSLSPSCPTLATQES